MSTVERALQLADTGQFDTIAALRAVLSREGYDGVVGHTSGGGIVKQLKARLLAAKG